MQVQKVIKSLNKSYPNSARPNVQWSQQKGKLPYGHIGFKFDGRSHSAYVQATYRTSEAVWSSTVYEKNKQIYKNIRNYTKYKYCYTNPHET